MKTRLIVIVSLLTIVIHLCIAVQNRLRPELCGVNDVIPPGAHFVIAQGDSFAVILVNKESEYGSDDEKADKIKLSAMLSAMLRVSQEQLSGFATESNVSNRLASSKNVVTESAPSDSEK